MTRCLVLNKVYVPLRLTTKYSAIGRLYCGVVKAIRITPNSFAEYTFDEWLKLDDWPDDTVFVHSPQIKIAVPRVVRLLNYSKVPKHTLRLTKHGVFSRDDCTCYICGKRFNTNALTLDHYVPVSRGGKNTWLNLVTACKKCNNNKGDRLWSELNYKPKFLPTEPSDVSHLTRIKMGVTEKYPEWHYFGV